MGRRLLWAGVAVGLIGIFGLLAGCGSRSTSQSDYRSEVLALLNGAAASADSPATPALNQMVSQLVNDSACMGDSCLSASRFSHLNDLANSMRPSLSEIRGPLCGDQLKPSAADQPTQARLCAAISSILDDVTSLQTSTQSAMTIAQYQSPAQSESQSAVTTALGQASENITQLIAHIKETFSSLNGIGWLQPALTLQP